MLEAGEIEAAEEAGGGGLHGVVGFAAGGVDGGDDEGFKHGDVSGGGRGRGGSDGEFQQLFLAVHAGGDGAAAGVGFDDGGGEALLHLLAHGGGLGEHVLHLGDIHRSSFRGW